MGALTGVQLLSSRRPTTSNLNQNLYEIESLNPGPSRQTPRPMTTMRETRLSAQSRCVRTFLKYYSTRLNEAFKINHIYIFLQVLKWGFFLLLKANRWTVRPSWGIGAREQPATGESRLKGWQTANNTVYLSYIKITFLYACMLTA